MADPVWRIDKSVGGVSFSLTVGITGAPGSHRIDGLSREDASALGDALREIERRVEWRVKATIREALGVDDD